jgi:DNA-binding CsgD family transcriptional regulator
MVHEGLPWTPAELRIIELICQGLNPREIAQMHRNSVYTIRTHVTNARERVGAKTTAQLVAVYLRRENRAAA